jgi:hypothetical protein
MITYLETRENCAEIDGICLPLTPNVLGKLDTHFYKKIMTNDFLAGNKDFVGGFENGAAFHMAVTVYYQIQYEITKKRQPIEIESSISIPLYNATGVNGKPYVRVTDIVLDGGDGIESNILVETKSYKSPVDPKRFTKWDLSRGNALVSEDKTSSKAAHKQFVLDRVAALNENGDLTIAGDIQWWFHGFTRSAQKSIKGYDERDVDGAFKHLQKLPLNGNSDIMKASLGTSINSSSNLKALRKKIGVFSVKKAILEDFKKELFGVIENSVYDELVINSKHDLP